MANIPNGYTLLRRLLKLGDFQSIGSDTTLRESSSPNSKRKFDHSGRMSELTKISRISGRDATLCDNDTESLEHITKDTTEPKLQIWEHKDFVMEDKGIATVKGASYHEQERPTIYGGEPGHLQSVVTGGIAPSS